MTFSVFMEYTKYDCECDAYFLIDLVVSTKVGKVPRTRYKVLYYYRYDVFQKTVLFIYSVVIIIFVN